MEQVASIAQPDQRERINPFVLPETAVRIKVACARTGKTIGEIIDGLAQHLPEVEPPTAQ